MPAIATALYDDLAAAAADFYRRPEPGRRLNVRPERPLSVRDFERFCAEHPEAFAELEPDGTVILFAHMTSRSHQNEFRVGLALGNWWLRTGAGLVYGATAGFQLPDGSVRVPDAAWISPEQLARLAPESHDSILPLAPDFVIEVMSKGDRLKVAQEKMRDTWLANGVRLGWLLWPKRRRAFVYAAGEDVREVTEWPSVLDASPVVEGFRFDLGLLQS